MEHQARVQALVERQIGRGDVFNAIVSAQSSDGRINVAAAAGVADHTTGAAITVDSRYSIASITKMYTASVILMLHEQGLLDLDETIGRYLPGWLIEGIHVYQGTDYSDQIKVYQLVNQTSGLADYFLDKPTGGHSVFDELKQGHDMALDITRVASIVRGLSPKFPPGAANGTKAHYADTNYRLLGAIIESVTGRPVAEAFQQMIFTPLNLTHTALYDPADTGAGRPATIYLKDSPVELPQFFASNSTDGGIVATVGENLTLLRAFFGGKLFDKKWFERMTARWNNIFFPMQYGYGMMRVNLSRAFSPFKPFPEFIGHSGSTGSFAYYCAEKDLYLAGTLNQIAAPSRPIRLMMQIANMLVP